MADFHDHDHDHDHDDDGNALYAKITAMTVLFVASTIFGLLPFKLSKWLNWTVDENARTSTVISTLLSFGGGVLLATTFLHLQPEIAETIESLQAKGSMGDLSFSLAPFLMCAGFFMIYLIEEVIHTYLLSQENSSKAAANGELEGAFVRGINARESVLLKRKKKTEIRNGSISTTELISNDVESQKDERTNNNETKGSEAVVVKKDPHNGHNHNHATHNHNHIPVFKATDDESMLVSSLRGLLIVLALSIHELFEGLAVGLEPTAASAWYMFGAVSAHKLVIAFCIGVELVVIRTKLWLGILYVIIFAIVSPIGIGVGILLSEANNAEAFAVPSVILQGLASGTLLYVIFFEVLSKEKSGIIQYFAVVAGYFIMFGLQLLTGHQHSHGGAEEGHNLHSHSHDHEHGHDAH
ncbi:zinc transporter ZIP3 [Culicoides brevitarsis]|uniref:zinc transporter ZIP3 n=1 Tax=Culicoides brevitarsis TaxID=469753 RepID=UPI00307B26E0